MGERGHEGNDLSPLRRKLPQRKVKLDPASGVRGAEFTLRRTLMGKEVWKVRDGA